MLFLAPIGYSYATSDEPKRTKYAHYNEDKCCMLIVTWVHKERGYSETTIMDGTRSLIFAYIARVSYRGVYWSTVLGI